MITFGGRFTPPLALIQISHSSLAQSTIALFRQLFGSYLSGDTALATADRYNLAAHSSGTADGRQGGIDTNVVK